MRAERGFTLLEILAALAIAAVGIAAVAKTTTAAVSIAQSTEDRVLASWVASNRLAELQLSRHWPDAGTRDAEEVLGGRTWYYREQISITDDPDLIRVDLSVFTDKDHEQRADELFGYLARYSPPSTPPEPEQPDEQPEDEGQQNEGGDGQGDGAATDDTGQASLSPESEAGLPEGGTSPETAQ